MRLGNVALRRTVRKKELTMALEPMWIAALAALVIAGVTIALRQRGEGITKVPGVPTQRGARPISSDPAPAIRQLLDAGNKIEAIRIVRQQTNMGLKEAKDYVERLATDELPILPGAPSSVPPVPVAARDMDSRVLILLGQHQKIEAIKLVRKETSMGLKEAKDYVEALEP